jgi:hypothetical protein
MGQTQETSPVGSSRSLSLNNPPIFIPRTMRRLLTCATTGIPQLRRKISSRTMSVARPEKNIKRLKRQNRKSRNERLT